MLMGINLAWGLLNPLKNVPQAAQPPAVLTKAATAYKFQRLKEQKNNPDFAIFGSSLPMCAFFCADRMGYFVAGEGARIQRARMNLLQSYPTSGYLQKKLSKELNNNTSVFNFSMSACMASDARVILDRMIASGKSPKTIIFAVGLRDFADNINPPPGETPIYTALCDTSYLLNNLSDTVNLKAFPHLLLSSVFKTYGLRNECKVAFEHKMCDLLHRKPNRETAENLVGPTLESKVQAANPESTASTAITSTSSSVSVSVSVSVSASAPTPASPRASASKTENSIESKKSQELTGAKELAAKNDSSISAPTSTSKPVSGDDNTAKVASRNLASLDYVQRYSPADYRQLEEEMSELEWFIKRCHQNNIKLIVVNMPVSSGHPKLSPPGLRERYLQNLSRIASSADLYLDYENNTVMNDADFMDTVHLNPDGAQKFIDDLVTRYTHSTLCATTRRASIISAKAPKALVR